MDTKVWGPKAWFFIHNIALHYPKQPTNQDKQAYRQFFYSLGHVLPCEVCQQHYIGNLVSEELESGLISNTNLFRWTVDMHNKVNVKKGCAVLSYDMALQEIKGEYQNKYGNPKFQHWAFMFLVIVLLIMLTRKPN